MAADPDDGEEGGCRRRRKIRPTRGVDGWAVGGGMRLGGGGADGKTHGGAGCGGDERAGTLWGNPERGRLGFRRRRREVREAASRAHGCGEARRSEEMGAARSEAGREGGVRGETGRSTSGGGGGARGVDGGG
jgi:hypothetical protein